MQKYSHAAASKDSTPTYVCPMHADVIRHKRGVCPRCGMMLVKQEEGTPLSKVTSLALSATLHCLTGCAIGEIIGVTIGTHSGFAPRETIALASVLSFMSGYTVSTWPLLRAKLSFTKALRLVLAADTVSILTMTIVDNIVILIIPGAMDKDLIHPIYWLSRIISLTAAFIAAYPVNLYLLKRGKGHALYHAHHHVAHDEKTL